MLNAYQFSLFRADQPGLSVTSDPNATADALNQVVLNFLSLFWPHPNWNDARYYAAAREAALHPNTDLENLIDLARIFPWEVSRNPALELGLAIGEVTINELSGYNGLYNLVPTRNASDALIALLERHWRGSTHQIEATLRLLQHPGVSREFLAAAESKHKHTNHPHFRDALFYHPNNPEAPAWPAEPFTYADVLEQWPPSLETHLDAFAYLARHGLISLEAARAYREKAGRHSTNQRRHIPDAIIAHHPNSAPAEREAAIETLRNSRITIRDVHPPVNDVLPEALVHLVVLKKPSTHNLLALSGGQPDDITKFLITHPNPAVRAGVALSGAAPQWATDFLLEDTNARVRATAQEAQAHQAREEQHETDL